MRRLIPDHVSCMIQRPHCPGCRQEPNLETGIPSEPTLHGVFDCNPRCDARDVVRTSVKVVSGDNKPAPLAQAGTRWRGSVPRWKSWLRRSRRCAAPSWRSRCSCTLRRRRRNRTQRTAHTTSGAQPLASIIRKRRSLRAGTRMRPRSDPRLFGLWRWLFPSAQGAQPSRSRSRFQRRGPGQRLRSTMHSRPADRPAVGSSNYSRSRCAALLHSRRLGAFASRFAGHPL